jgi:O-antigen ligase
MDLLALATGLVAAAIMAGNQNEQSNSRVAWLFLALLILPICIQLLFMDLRNPWRAWQIGLYITSSWLVFRMSGASSAQLLGSNGWNILLACIGNFYVVFAVAQQFQLPLTPGFELFPVWQDHATNYAGVLMQTNMQGLFLALVCAALWSRCSKRQGYLAWLIASLLPCAGILATSSRGSSIIMAMSIIVLIFISKHKTRLLIRIISIVMIAIGIVSYWQAFAPSDASLITRFEATGIQIRLLIWDMSMRLFLEHIWLGIGAGNLISYGTEILLPSLTQHPEWAEIASSQLSGGNIWTHNLPLQFLLEWGIAGGIAIFGLMLIIGKKCWQTYAEDKIELESGQTQAGLGLLLILAHGMVSVAILQGFFLVLFAVYAAALLTGQTGNNPTTRKSSPSIIVLLLPAIFLAFNWQWFVLKSSAIENAINTPIQSESFIRPVALAIDSPWSSRSALEWYFIKLRSIDVSSSLWVGSEHLAFRYWLQHQSSLSLRYRILIAHLKNNYSTEKRLIQLHHQAYPSHAIGRKLLNHLKYGHMQGEAIDIWN